MPHAMYFTGNTDTVTKINHIPYQTIVYNENGMFTTKLMNDTPVEIVIDNGATPSILPLHTYNKFPILHTYPKTESNRRLNQISLLARNTAKIGPPDNPDKIITVIQNALMTFRMDIYGTIVSMARLCIP